MRKLALVLALMVGFAFMSQAQFLTTYKSAGNTSTDITTDYTLTNTTAGYWLIYAGQDYYTAQALIVNLDSASGDHTNVAIQLQGRYTDMDAWTNIGSAKNWKGTTSDTTIVYLNATENGYRQFKILYTGTGTGTTTIDRQFFKQWFGNP